MEDQKYLFILQTPAGGVRDLDSANNMSRQLILQEAEKLGIEWEQIPGAKTFRLQHSDHVEYFTAEIPGTTTYVGYMSCFDKSRTKQFLQNAGISTPKGFLITKFTSEEDKKQIFDSLQKPLVVKPTLGKQGDGVLIGIKTFKDFLLAVKQTLSYEKYGNSDALAEEQWEGSEYRILATRKKVVGVIQRIPANIVGDGVHTIEELIKEKNKDPRRKEDPRWYLVTIKIDEVVLKFLEKQNLELSSIPTKGERVFLRENSNISTGGDSVDMTDEIHETAAQKAVAAVNAIPGLAIAGVDFMTNDIGGEQGEKTYTIIEVNHSPGLEIHHFPATGKPRNAAKEFVLTMFPELIVA